MSFTVDVSIIINADKLDHLDGLINNLVKETSGKVMGTGFALMTSSRDYSVEFEEQQNAEVFMQTLKERILQDKLGLVSCQLREPEIED